MKGKAVIVTGGGGSIGSEICDRVVTFGAARLLVIENSEPALYAVTETLAAHDIQRRHRGPHRGYPRSRTHPAADARVQAGYRVPCRRAQARADPRARLERGRQDQHLRIGERRRCGAGGRRQGDGDDLDRQGDRAGLDAGADQAFRRDVLPGARSRSGGAARRQAADAADLGTVRQCAGIERIGGAEVQGADRGGRSGHGHASRHGPLFHDHPRSLRPRADRGHACADAGAARRLGLCAEHGPAGQDRRPRRADDLVVRPAAGLRYRYRLQRHAAGRAAERDPVRREEPTVEIGIAGIMAAKPNEPPMATLREWLAALEQAIARDDRATIKALLKEAVPEFGAASAGATVASAPRL